MMTRASSQSQSASVVSRGGPMGVAPHGSATAMAGLRHRRTMGDVRGGGFGGSGGKRNMLRLYTDDVIELNTTPTIILVMSLYFKGLIKALHVIEKLYRYRSGGA